MELILVGMIAGAGLMAAVIFGTVTWYERRYPLMQVRA